MYRMSKSLDYTLTHEPRIFITDTTTLGEEIRWGLGQAVDPVNLASFLTVSGIRP